MLYNTRYEKALKKQQQQLLRMWPKTVWKRIPLLMQWHQIPMKGYKNHKNIPNNKEINIHLYTLSSSLSSNRTPRSGSCHLKFLKSTLVQINPKVNSKPYDYLYKQLLRRTRGKIKKLHTVLSREFQLTCLPFASDAIRSVSTRVDRNTEKRKRAHKDQLFNENLRLRFAR